MKKVPLGYCSSAHGIRGELVFKLESGSDSVLDIGHKILLDEEPFTIEKINYAHKTIVKLEGVNERDDSQRLVGRTIYADREDFPSLAAGEFYLVDLIGFSVFCEGRSVGQVESFYNNQVQDIIVISQENDKALELPFIEQFFPTIDFDSKSIEMIEVELI